MRIQKMAVWKRIAISALLAVALIFTAFGGLYASAAFAYAAEEYPFDETNVMDDLQSSTVNGKKFDILDYVFDENKRLQIINFVEFNYSYRSSARENYALYIYVYNPAAIKIIEESGQNKIQMAVAWNKSEDGTVSPTNYEKFRLKFCNKSEDDNYKGLFYKFRVVDTPLADGSTMADRVNSNERRYDVSGVELLTVGNSNATEYGVGGTYKFTGYVKGCGPDKYADSSLTCEVETLESISLKLNHTNFRSSSVSSVGKDHYNEVNTVYFSVPESFFETYGNLQKIHAEWWEYKTKKMAVTSDMELYNTMLDYTGVEIGDPTKDVPFSLETIYTERYLSGCAYYNYAWTYNVDLSPKLGADKSPYIVYSSLEIQHILPYVFYSPAKSVDGIFKFLYSKPTAGEVGGNIVADYIYSYTNDLGHGYIDCNGRQISKDLFADSVDSGRTRGYNNKTVDFGDTFDLKSYDSNHNWINKLFDYGFSWPETSEDYKNVQPIITLTDNMITGSADDIAKSLLVNSDDVSDIKGYYAAETAKNNRVIFFRFANTDYYCADGYTKKNVYIAQETVFLDFDVIDLTFNKDGVYYVIPAVASPIDIINGLTPPPARLNILRLILLLFGLILLIIILWPFLPTILKLVWSVITFPFKILAGIGKGISGAVKNKRAEKSNESAGKRKK